MKRILFLGLIPLLMSSCASFLSGFSVGSMVSGHAANVMSPERKAIIQEAKKQTLDELDYHERAPVRSETF